jgi:CRISPR/Cas system Type II protein with McrA/HNH and RuvC-like nuclease domain
MNNRVRFSVLARDNYTCIYCGRKPPAVALEVDHAISRSNNGDDTIDNYVTSCEECNRGKNSKNYNKAFDSWDEELLCLVSRFREYENLLESIKQQRDVVHKRISVMLQEYLPGYKIVDTKTGKVLSGLNGSKL